MTFTDATILAALAAMAVPLAIHLLGRRRARVVTLPTVRFAEGAHIASRGRRWLKSAALLATRLAVIALLVLALAGPYLAPGAPPYLAPGEYTGGQTSAGARGEPPPVYSRGAKYDNTAGAGSPLRVLIVDAAGQEAGRLRSADLVAATFAWGVIEKKGAASIFSPHIAHVAAAQAGRDALGAADVVFWVGPQAPADAAALTEYLARGGAVVWVPGAAPQPPDPPLAAALGVRAAGTQDVPGGITIDPGGYTSDLVAAFEGGTGGDLGAPVFRRRLLFGDATAAIAFRDGPAAVAEGRPEKGRTLALAAGPSPAWGDLAGRAEFVVLMHSLAEALAPASDHASLAPGEYTGGRTREGATCATAQVPATPLAPCLALAFVVVLAAESLLAAQSARRANPHI
ncbi:MAG: BatA domain-containing protein [Planctomycetota bacterium]|nr:BatA domain-containing protein [Planctomycetota bacterium]